MPEAFKWKDLKLTDLVLKHQTLCLALILLPVPATGLKGDTDLVPVVNVA